MPFDQAMEINPPVQLIPARVYPFVDMQALDPSSRTVGPSEHREFLGGGSRFMDGDTLMARITPCLENGKIARFRGLQDQACGHGSTEFIVIRGRNGITDNDFAYYLTRWEIVRSYAISHMTGTSGRQRVPVDALHYLEVRIPPLPEQRAIAHILGTLDDKIDLNRRMNETLEAMARAIFKSWFVDFDPVTDNALRAGNPIPSVLAEKGARRRELLSRANAEGRDSCFPKHIADLFPDRFVDSDLGPIPAGWRVVYLPEVMDVNPPRALRKGDKAPYLDMANMPTRGHTPDAITERSFGSGMRFMNGDTLVARITPCLENGKTAYVDFLADGQVGWGSTEYLVLCPKSPVPSEFGYCFARSAEFREFAIQSMSGTSGRQRVPPDALSHYLIAAPSQSISLNFSKIVKPLFAKASQVAKESRILTALRDALLPKLISGELRVEDAERLLEVRP
jgi:type I restriction enzyme S subunit